MDESSGFAATLLDTTARGLATLTVELVRQRVENNDDKALIESENMVADTESRLRQLAEAAAVGIPDLFAAHVEWSRSTCAARGVSATFLPAVLAGLAEVLERELPSSAWESLRPAIAAGRAALTTPLQSCKSQLDEHSAEPLPHTDLSRRFLLTLLEARRDDAILLIEQAVEGGIPVSDLHGHVLAASLVEIGRMWQTGEVHVADERLATAIVADALALLRQRMPRRAARAGRVLVASVEGNLHELGARMVADRLVQQGWTTLFLGANVPSTDLLLAAVEHEVDVLALSLSMGIHARTAAKVIAGAHALSTRRLPVVVGGWIFERVPQLWRALGADAHAASVDDAAATCVRLSP